MNDTDLPPSEMGLSFDSEHRLRSENLSFDIDVWYPLLKDFTFRSVFIPLRREEAKAIKAFHDVSWRHTRQRLESHEINILKNLERDITATIAQEFAASGGAFLRLCGRSPKDGEPLDRTTPVETYLRAIEAVVQEKLASGSLTESPLIQALTSLQDAKHIDPMIKMAAIARVSWLKVRDGKEALSLLLTSERVYAEMIDWLRYGEPEQLCLRQWQDDLTLDNEFRVFVHRGCITAVSQYDHYSYIESLHRRKAFLLTGIVDLCLQVHPLVGVGRGSYVVDVGYLPSSNTFIVVELSPFTPCTGAALFHWSGDIDVLTGPGYPLDRGSDSGSGSGSDAVESLQPTNEGLNAELLSRICFRLKAQEDLHPQIADLLELNWDDRWMTPERPYWKLFETESEGEGEGNEKEASSPSIGLFSWMSRGLGNLFGVPSTAESALATSSTLNTGSTATKTSTLLFVYGTLKSSFHWNVKYLSPRLGARLLGPACTHCPMPLVIGDCGVPYLLGAPELAGQGCRVRGELWEVTGDALQGLDEYEGVTKGYYARATIDVVVNTTDSDTTKGPESLAITQAYVYVLQGCDEKLQQREFLSEYDLDSHTRLYQPILHIQRKQLAYFKAPSGWGKTTEPIPGGIEAPDN